jgi:hypothetical protein
LRPATTILDLGICQGIRLSQENRIADDRTLGTVVFKGKSGKEFRFQAWPLTAKFKAAGGVYIVTKRSFEDRTFTTKASHQPLVIGHTADLAEALISKAQLAKLIAQGANCICTCAVTEAVHRAEIEKDLIDGNEDFRGRLQSLYYLVEPAAAPQAPIGS